MPDDGAKAIIFEGAQYAAEDFLVGTGPYEYVYSYKKNPFEEEQILTRLAGAAQKVGVLNFKKLYRDYVRLLKQSTEGATKDNITQFEHQGAELNTGEWVADDSGVWQYGAFGGQEIACTHPIMPTERLRNIDTGELKVKLNFRRGGQGRRVWNELIADFDTISNAKNIVQLSKVGISVTSGKRAQNLVDYLTDVMDLNYDVIPERKSVSRLGWNDEGFAPYIDGTIYDGNPGFAKAYDAVKQKGSFDKWLEVARGVRAYSVTARIVLAASFASVLIKPLGTLPFFVHLWGGESSGAGKSVAQMVGASVWGDPHLGGPLFPTFRSTPVGFEVIAGFLHNLPVFIDDLQLARDSRGRMLFDVYQLAAGAGKLRSNKALGLSQTPTWATCFITSGETAIVNENDGAGAVNRVIDIECKMGEKVVEDGRATANIARENYGHAGKMFVDRLIEPDEMATAKELYEAVYAECLHNNTTEKQALAAAMLVTADILATDWIFRDGMNLTVGQMETFLKTSEQVSIGARGYAYMCDWVTTNAVRMQATIKDSNDTYGVIDDGWAYIIRSVFNRACEQESISSRALLSYMRSRNLIVTRGRALTKSKKINGIPTECVVMRLPEDDYSDLLDVNGPTPFDKVEHDEAQVALWI